MEVGGYSAFTNVSGGSGPLIVDTDEVLETSRLTYLKYDHSPYYPMSELYKVRQNEDRLIREIESGEIVRTGQSTTRSRTLKSYFLRVDSNLKLLSKEEWYFSRNP